ncbi:Csac_0668 family 2Fe-2S cluster-binding (seleno)protein [Acidaminobacter sp.]|uniref:Csac_0668 family 2Fe-2S cluster-binding (seleno)protein n=1 Tax=Acidaminobacter sp. TaxID=1872102 RepID=UPI0027D99E28|nr:(2Fe-2S)-binding protein [Acidaminobacter sp.]
MSEMKAVPQKACPHCGKQGRPVGGVTVKHLVEAVHQDKVDAGDAYFICMEEACDVVYYEASGDLRFLKHEVSVPVWFKKDADPKYACYCSRVTVEDVIHAVVDHGASTVKDVNQLTGAMKNANCKLSNPLGVCCHSVIQEAIDQGKAMKGNVGDGGNSVSDTEFQGR